MATMMGITDFWGFLAKCAALAAVSYILVTAFRLEPDRRGYGTHEQLGMKRCGFLEATGRPCFSCGMTTAFALTVRGRVVAALRSNILGTLLAVLTIAAPGWLVHSLASGKPALRFLYPDRGKVIVAVFLFLLIASWTVQLLTFR